MSQKRPSALYSVHADEDKDGTLALALSSCACSLCRVGSTLLRMLNSRTKNFDINIRNTSRSPQGVGNECEKFKLKVRSRLISHIPSYTYTYCMPPCFDSDSQLRAGEGQILARLHGCMRQKRIGIIFPLKTGNSFACSDLQFKLGLWIINRQLGFDMSDMLRRVAHCASPRRRASNEANLAGQAGRTGF